MHLSGVLCERGLDLVLDVLQFAVLGDDEVASEEVLLRDLKSDLGVADLRRWKADVGLVGLYGFVGGVAMFVA